jgi:hypothetical protein
MRLPNAKAWKAAFDKEVSNILDRGVLGPFITDEQLAQESLITHKRIPMKMLFDVKLNPDNSFDKLKCRLVVLGHPGYLRRGEHFWNTYSASSVMSTPRIMQAVCVQMGYKRRCYDLVSAYLWAVCRPDERLAIDLPSGMGKKDEKGRQMCRILEKTCYGCPYSDRRFCELRDEYILETFSKDGYTVFQSQYDPCLFVIRRTSDNAHCILSTFTDDIDSIGSHDDALDYIAGMFDERFAIKMVNANFMVGVQRITSEDGKTVTLSQPGFVDNLVDTFRDKLTGRNVNTPFPPGLHLQRSGDPMAKEAGKAIYDRGLYSVIGSLLWTMRNCHPETAIGVNYLCSVMSEPTEAAWAAAMHMIKWLRDNKDMGLKFTRQKQDPTLECYYDASANPDMIDHRMRGGFVLMMNGAAVDWGACKLPHVGISTLHVEYQALFLATKATIYHRHILEDMGFGHWIQAPTLMYGDNDACTSLGRENMVSPGNRWFSRDLFFYREQFKTGTIDPRRVDTDENLADIMTKPLAYATIMTFILVIKGYQEAS